jgi:hypothetical protein
MVRGAPPHPQIDKSADIEGPRQSGEAYYPTSRQPIILSSHPA